MDSHLKPGFGSLLRSDSSDIESQVRHELALVELRRLWTRASSKAVVHISRACTFLEHSIMASKTTWALRFPHRSERGRYRAGFCR